MKDERKWVCGVCKMVFDEPGPLKEHIDAEHQVELRQLNKLMEKYKSGVGSEKQEALKALILLQESPNETSKASSP
jgi:hypothetical protein